MTQIQIDNLSFDPRRARTSDITDGLVNRFTESKAGWYTTPDGSKARGKDAARSAVAAYLRQVAKETDADKAPVAPKGKYADAPMLSINDDVLKQEVGSIFYVESGTKIPVTGRPFKADQPVTVIKCRLCETPRALHLQDVPQSDNRCVECIKDERRHRARVRAAERRAERAAAQE